MDQTNSADDDAFSFFGSENNASQQLDLTDQFLLEALTKLERILAAEPNAAEPKVPPDDGKTCNVCHRRFTSAWSLKRHKKTCMRETIMMV